MPSTGRAPLPASVYWRRRLVLVTVAALLFVAVSHVLQRGSDGSGSGSGEPRAVQVAGTPTAASPTRRTPTRLPTRGPKSTPTRIPTPAPTPTPTPLAVPEGDCEDSDVAVEPSVPVAVAGGDVALVVGLHSVTSPACYWDVSSSTLALKIAHQERVEGEDGTKRDVQVEVWSTRECPDAVLDQTVVLRPTGLERIVVTWDGKRSDDTCSGRTDLARQGHYRLFAAAIGGEPAVTGFDLAAPPEPTLTPTPAGQPTGSPSGQPTFGPTQSPTSGPTTSPTSGPTTSPAKGPTKSPTSGPTKGPTAGPAASPTTQSTRPPIDPR